MMNPASRVLPLCAVLTLAACSILQPQPDLSRFFVLTPMTPPDELVAAKPLRLGLGPIDFPAYLQRPQMITRMGPNEITLSEQHRWGEPLDVNFGRVVAQNLAALLATDQILFYPWYNGKTLDYAIQISVVRFEVDTNGEAHLLARWKIVDPAADKTLRNGQSDWQQQTTDSSPDAAVAALSSLVEKLSREIADGLEAMRR